MRNKKNDLIIYLLIKQSVNNEMWSDNCLGFKRLFCLGAVFPTNLLFVDSHVDNKEIHGF